jgi:hypothetical protein
MHEPLTGRKGMQETIKLPQHTRGLRLWNYQNCNILMMVLFQQYDRSVREDRILRLKHGEFNLSKEQKRVV